VTRNMRVSLCREGSGRLGGDGTGSMSQKPCV
jgi:hypothetical protein